MSLELIPDVTSNRLYPHPFLPGFLRKVAYGDTIVCSWVQEREKALDVFRAN